MSVFTGDCLDIMKQLSSSSVDLIYLDPPYFSQRTHSLQTRDHTMTYSFDDNWNTIEEYLAFLKVRLTECHRLLQGTGSIFFHCDRSASHYIRVLLDQIFGVANFRSEIIWFYRRWSNAKNGLLNSHQTIYFYSKSEQFTFNHMYTPYSPTTNVDQILQERGRNTHNKSTYKRDEAGHIIQGKEKKGVPLSDVWSIPYLNPKAKERTGYPTQKPIILLEQIVKLATAPGDLVLDPFCGSGSMLVAAKLLGRTYAGIDIAPEATNLTVKRLNAPMKTDSHLIQLGEDTYIHKTDAELEMLKRIDAIPVQRNSGIDGFLKISYKGKPIAVRIQKPSETLQQAQSKLLRASTSKGCLLKILILTQESDHSLPRRTDYSNDDGLLIVSDYMLLIQNWLHHVVYNCDEACTPTDSLSIAIQHSFM